MNIGHQSGLWKILFFVIKYVKIGMIRKYIGLLVTIEILEFGMEIMQVQKYWHNMITSILI